ncbi:MAG TPA: DUF1847 domain-containing protein [Deltaproteobacteria bacterium]|nr:DUF1847 domain-containing protein [Deltaproteobacteria bacterium]HQB38263.1 DUF1847 domain-containing protein [Deltaproteobacteria bacterium]
MQCANCKHNKCYTSGQNCTRLTVDQVVEQYQGLDGRIMQAAGRVEARNYMQMTRLEESVEFARQMDVKTVGLAFCIGFTQEAWLISAYFEKFFKVHSVCCKVCSVGKEELGLEQIKPGTHEAMCNPKIQAAILADNGTELNFTIGLCVGHDMLFNSASAAPVSTLAVKDRVLAHNPLGAVYSRYWRRKLGINPDGQV